MKDVRCRHCGTVFTPSGSRAQTCSIACRIASRSKLNPLTGCVEWQGCVGAHGYGVVKVPGGVKLAHRALFEAKKGEIPAGYYIIHWCDNPRCVTLGHLRVATPQANAEDMVRKQRHWAQGAKRKRTAAKISAARLSHDAPSQPGD